jgi:hypothetical protein
MEAVTHQRERLGRFVDLARVYRGWTKGELSTALRRDPTKIIPQSGNPKLDLIAGIAEALDWTIGDVAESVCHDFPSTPDHHAACSFEVMDKAVYEAHREARWSDMLDLAKTMLSKAETPKQRAIAFNRMAGGYNGLGRYANALRVIQAAITEPGIPESTRFMLHINLANAHYTLWHLVEAKSIASELISQIGTVDRTERNEKARFAFLKFVRGNSIRRMMSESDSRLKSLASASRDDLSGAYDMYDELNTEFDEPYYRGLRNVCRGALTEIDAADGEVTPEKAVNRILAGLDEVVDPFSVKPDIELESWGWWAIFGCNIALRHLSGEDMHRHMAVFTNKAIEIAECLGNWSMRERAFTLEHFRRQQADIQGVSQEPWPLDDEDIRVITGTMGRFPAFRDVGWQILQNAQVLESE